jgi:very-short-patch-repair endonuclease
MADKRINHGDGQAIAALAVAQHGVVSAAQLYALHLSRDQVSQRVSAGWLHRLHRGVYAVGHSRLSPAGFWMAATLAAGPGAVLSHISAATLWQILGPRNTSWGMLVEPGDGKPTEVHVIKPGLGGIRQRGGIILHRSTTLLEHELTAHRRIPVTGPGRTLLDIAASAPRRVLERALDEAERSRLCAPTDLAAILEEHRGQPGAGALGRVVRSHAIGSTLTRSELEERFLGLCRDRHLPQPVLNVPLHGLTVDCLWAAAKLIVELDGRRSHGTRRAFQDDRDRDSLLAAHGYVTLRFTWWDVTRRPGVVAQRLRRVLAGRT